MSQYIGLDGAYSHYDKDTNSEPSSRDALHKTVEVALIGAGHAGILAAHSLLDKGINDFCILEKAGDFGGTWYWNRYPNCRCDVESYIYLPLIEQFGEMPTEKYVRSSEILAHACKVAKALNLYPKTLFQTRVTEMRWVDEKRRWLIKTDNRDLISARFVSLGSGPLNRPKLPGIKGIELFKGKSFHTSRWDYEYTGGNEKGNLLGLKDKRVAIVGTGASAVQAIPALAEHSKHLFVVQRTPAAVEERKNRATDENWWKTARYPGWWEDRARNFDGFSVGEIQEEDLVSDGWTKSWAQFSEAARASQNRSKDNSISPLQKVDYEKMGAIRDRIDRLVRDADTAESLKPYYNWFCKRPLFHDGYYESFNRTNVTLLDTKGKGLDQITDCAIQYGGKSFGVDCIIFASGFEAAAPSNRSGGFSLIGRGGKTIEQYWKQGMRSLHGMFVHEFPNLAIIHGIKQAATTWNGTYILTQHTKHFADLVSRCKAQDIVSFEPKKSAEEAWLDELEDKAAADFNFLEDCTPGYINNEGMNLSEGIYASTYGPGVFEYLRVLDKWRLKDIDEDMLVTKL